MEKKQTKKSKSKKLKSKKQKTETQKWSVAPLSGLPYDIDMEGGLNVSEKQMSDNAFQLSSIQDILCFQYDGGITNDTRARRSTENLGTEF